MHLGLTSYSHKEEFGNMRRRVCIFLLAMGLTLFPNPSCAQEDEIEEEESAEVFLEEYTDEFQEKFFEALKHKGIENLDRAINLLLECKRLDPNNSAVDHELAKAYLASKQFILAQEFGISALAARTDNYWVLHTLVEIVEGQGGSLEMLQDYIPYNDTKFRENLALIYYRQQNYEAALEILNGIKISPFIQQLTLKMNDFIKADKVVENQEDVPVVMVEKEDPIQNYVSMISEFMASSDFKSAASTSEEAMESFPTQPHFYYTYGLALNSLGKHKEAIVILESGLDYLLEDLELTNKMYRELVDANNALGNSSKANMYLSKIKSGS